MNQPIVPRNRRMRICHEGCPDICECISLTRGVASSCIQTPRVSWRWRRCFRFVYQRRRVNWRVGVAASWIRVSDAESAGVGVAQGFVYKDAESKLAWWRRCFMDSMYRAKSTGVSVATARIRVSRRRCQLSSRRPLLPITEPFVYPEREHLASASTTAAGQDSCIKAQRQLALASFGIV
jgi:hypothetical protein